MILKSSDRNSSDFLLQVRVVLYCLAFTHLAIISTVLLKIDFSQSEDRSNHVYEQIKWMLLTAWVNLLCLVYFPLCAYCDWRQLRREADNKLVKILNKIRAVCFSSIILPTVMFTDLLFWRLWNEDRELIAPSSVHQMVPFWSQHSMHTVSLVVVILDLVLVPWKRPSSHKLRVAVMVAFLSVYLSMCAHSLSKGILIYPVMKQCNNFRLFVLIVFVYIEHLMYYTCQWYVVDLVWGLINNK